MIYRSPNSIGSLFFNCPNSIGSLFFNCPIRRTVTVKTLNIYKKQHGVRPCMEKMQFIFFVPPNEELEGTLHTPKFGCTPKNEGKRVHVPPDEKTCGHADFGCWILLPLITFISETARGR